MRDRLTRMMARWYYRRAYSPRYLVEGDTEEFPADCYLDTVPWISTWVGVCQSTVLQMIAAHFGIDRPRRHFDFLMGFTYGANVRAESGFSAIGTDPETGLVVAAPYLGLVRRYYVTDDSALYLRALRTKLARGYPLRIPVDMGALYGQAEPLPHNEVLVGYDSQGFFFYEPTCRPPAPCQPAHLPPGEQGLYVTEDRLLEAVESEAMLFSYPWRYPFVLFEPGPRREDLAEVWQQNGRALVGGRRWGQCWGAAAMEYQADEVERSGQQFERSRIELGLEVGAATRPDNAIYLRESFAGRHDMLQAAEHFDQAAQCFQAALDIVGVDVWSQASAAQVAVRLREAASAERAAGRIFLSQ